MTQALVETPLWVTGIPAAAGAANTELIPVNVDYRKLTVVLTTALQEAITKIETLETKVAALEGA